MATVLHRRWPAIFIGVGLLFASAAPGRALEISGSYLDKGTQVPTTGVAPKEVSLHALLNLVFEPELGRSQFDEAAVVEFVQTGTRVVEARIRDDAGDVRWQGRWTLGTDCARDGRSLVLHLRGPHSGDNRAVLVFERTSDDRLLQVTITEVNASTFGPSGRPVGTFLFARRP